MYHTHFNSIHSTQLYLRDNLVELKGHSNDILITASEQTLGVGRKGAKWDSYTNSLAMSFTLKPNHVPTLTPIEIGLIVVDFLKREYGISICLKWPNDLLTSEGQKCGGIIAQYIDTETIVAGLGLNLGKIDLSSAPPDYKHGLGNVAQLELSSEDQKNIPLKFYQYFLSHRLNDLNEIQKLFEESCLHMNKNVSVDDDGTEFTGKFLGIGKNGEALIEIEGITRSFIASSLKILN
ncbi:MAG: biotin--[acetyl-CoA-carboxylase] ligase [Bdellovibrionales bacterium]|nr:biotin--[acetyl-CoA-carboxylase] ligase [Bdellovibrionales bacterium]